MTDVPRVVWTDEMEAALKKGLTDGLTYRQISDMPIFIKRGVSRNALIGKALRKGWQELGSPANKATPRSAVKNRTQRVADAQREIKARQARERRAAKAAVAPPPPPAPATPPVEGKRFAPTPVPVQTTPATDGVRLLDATAQHCRWPLGRGDDGFHRCCGAPVIGGLSLQEFHCEAHHARLLASHHVAVQFRGELRRAAKIAGRAA